MAQLTITQKTGYDIEALAPQGQYLAVCLKIEDQFGVTRTKYQSQEEESRDVTRFLFGLKDLSTGALYLVQTYEYTISGLPNSNLMKFLTQWLGAQPQIGWDYCELESAGCMLTIAHKEAANTPGKVYAKIMSIAPVMAQLANQVPHPSEFAALVAAAAPDDVSAPQTGAAPVAGGVPQVAPQAAPPAPQAAPAPVATAGPAFPYGWTPHPQAPGQYYQGQEVLTEANLRARFEPQAAPPAPQAAPAPVGAPQAAAVSSVPQTAEVAPGVPVGNAPAPTAEPPANTLPVAETGIAPTVATSPSSDPPAQAQTPPLQAGPPAGNPF
jgi:hypothetical protein